MIEELEEINVDHFAFDYFKRNDNKKCIEISHGNRLEPVDRFFLFIDHSDCSPMCFVNEKISKTEKQLSNIEKFDIKSYREKNCYRALVTAKNIHVYELYLSVCLTERCLLLPIHKIVDKEVNLPNQQCDSGDSVNITDLLKADCWLQIFSYLNLTDLFQLSAVCTDFRALVQHNRKVKNLKSFHFKFYDKYFETEGEAIFADKSVSKMSEVLECIGQNLEEITISVGRTSNEIGIFDSLIRKVGPNLHTLRLCNFCWLSLILENTSSKVLGQIRTLCLDSQYYDIPIIVEIKKKFPNLERLSLHGRWKVVDFTDWSGIKELTLDRIISLNHASWMTWIVDVSDHFKNLETLKISNTMKRTIPLDSVGRLLQLKKLRNIQIEVVDTNCFDIILKMTQLNSVSLIFYKSIQELIENRLPQLAYCLPDLHHFDLTLKEEAFMPRDDLVEFISLAHQLKSVHLINDTIKIFLFIAPSFLEEILDARKRSQAICNEKSRLLVAFSKCFIDENVFKDASNATFREYIVVKNYTRPY